MATTSLPTYVAGASCGCSTTYQAGNITRAGIISSVRCATHAADDRMFARRPLADLDASLADLAAALRASTR